MANRNKAGKSKAAENASAEPPVVKNGWTIYAHPLLLAQLEALARQVPKSGPPNNAAKVLTWAVRAIFDEIPQDPARETYRQGGALGDENRHWFRDKYAGRFRLFFRYSSGAKIIVFAWVNDEDTKRTYGAKNDAYAVFRDMLAAGNPPGTWNDLLKQASAPEAVKRLKGRRSG
jgi:toxin YhaV